MRLSPEGESLAKEMKLRACRLPQFTIIFAALSWSLPVIGGEEGGRRPALNAPPADGENGAGECRRCGSTGRITCPNCNGQGSLRKPCPICSGKGRRPCPQCAVADPSTKQQLTPGKIPCTACGGKGVTEAAPDRPCFRCKGSRELICLLCFGRGTLSCPKTKYDKTCPTCGFVGRVPCPDCQGTKGDESSPHPSPVDAAGGDDLPVGAETEEDGPSEDSRPSAATVRREKEKAYSEASFRADHKAASANWEELKKECEEDRKVFKGESASDLRKLRSELIQVTRTISDGPASGAETESLKQRLKDARGQIEALDRSWGNLLDHFDRVEKLEGHLKVKWDELPQWTAKFQPREREAIREHLARLSSMLAVARKHSATLREENPERIAAGVKEALAAMEELKRDAEKVKLSAASRAKSGPKKAVLRSIPESDLRPQTSRPRPGTGDGPEREREADSSGVAGTGPDVPFPRRSFSAPSSPHFPSAAAPGREDGDQSSRSDGGRASDRLAITLGMLGVAICGALYYILHRRDGRMAPPPILKKAPTSSRSPMAEGRGSNFDD